MTEHPLHPDDELVELALGDVGEPRRGQLVGHLGSCARCRAAYEEIVDAVDNVLPAAPQIPPPVGFDSRVLDAIGVSDGVEPTTPIGRARRGRLRLLAAAAAFVVAAVAGGVVAVSVWDDDDPGPAVTANSAALRTSDGEVVGTVAVSHIDERQVAILDITRPAVGVPYHCRVLYEGGRAEDTRPWTVESPEGYTWALPIPQGEVTDMELVTDDGRVWAAAQLS